MLLRAAVTQVHFFVLFFLDSVSVDINCVSEKFKMDLKNEKWKHNRFNTCLVLWLVKKSVVRMISIKNVSPPIFLLWTKNVFSYIHGLPWDNLHFVFDNYSPPEDPIKVLSKENSDRGYKGKISSLNQALPKLEWQDFLTNHWISRPFCFWWNSQKENNLCHKR